MTFVTVNILEGKSKEYNLKATNTMSDVFIETMIFHQH